MKAGAGTLILSGSDSYTGGTSISAGILQIASKTALADGSSLSVGAGSAFIYDPSAAPGDFRRVARRASRWPWSPFPSPALSH